MTATPAVRFERVAKTYRGAQTPALQDVSFDIEAGEFFGLLGPNGAGKTSLISILAGLSRASGGRVSVMGHDVVGDFAAARRLLGRPRRHGLVRLERALQLFLKNQFLLRFKIREIL